MRDIPVQLNSSPSTSAQKSARYYNSGTAFQLKQTDVPPATFVDEANRALDPNTPTGVINCDISSSLGLNAPATTPNVLARYVVVRPNESLQLKAAASTLVFYAIAGSGQLDSDGTNISWQAGDVFLMPGDEAIDLRAQGDHNSILWVVGDDPLVRFLDVDAKSTKKAAIAPVHYPAKDIKEQIDLIYSADQEADTAGRALIFASERHDSIRNIAPVLTLALNTLDPGTQTRPHRHNSAAVMLVLAGEHCHSTVDDKVKEWSHLSTTITPPFAWHAHHNNGGKRAELLIIQDGGIFTHSRVNGFSFA
ncbi:cupin domain-containing protein [Tardiphaga sp. 215_C5_N2_1]|uniref:cupin domain-containing protein n=1 Tax=Tardiphaga sp. 215_C5_N2_1 TaxID=3240774 RepID=UPI003F8AC11C